MWQWPLSARTQDKAGPIHMGYNLFSCGATEKSVQSLWGWWASPVLWLVGSAPPLPSTSRDPLGKSTLIHWAVTSTSRKCRLESCRKLWFFLLWKFMKQKAGLEMCFQGGFLKQQPSCFRLGTKAGICSHSVYFLGKPHSQGIMRPSWDWVSDSSKLAQWCMTAFAFVLLCFKWDSKRQHTRPYFRHPNKQDWSSEALSAVWTDTMENAFKKSNKYSCT